MDVNVVELLTQLSDHEDESMQESPFRSYLGASEAGHECDRKIWLNFRFAKKKVYTATTLAAFARGKEEEKKHIEKLSLLPGVEIISQQDAFKDGLKEGHCDAVIKVNEKKYVLEIKTAKQEYFLPIKKEGCQNKQPVHYAQIQLYMHYLEIPQAIYYLINKNTDEVYRELIIYNKDYCVALVNRLNYILCSPTPPDKIANSPAFYMCKMCDYYKQCHGSEQVYQSCRTCKNVMIDKENIICNHFKKHIPFAEQTKDRRESICKQHSTIRELMPLDAELENIEKMIQQSFGSKSKITGVSENL